VTVLVVLAGYLIGSIPTGLLIIRFLRGIDIRTAGSGNVGATNVYRVAGLPVAVVVLLIDALKGAAPLWLARAASASSWGEVLAGIAAIIGHNWSAFMRLTGGKGIATSFGALAALSPAAAGAALAVWLIVAALTRYASLASLLAMAAAPLVMAVRGEPLSHLVFAALALIFALYRHRLNIIRLRAGTELRITDRAKNGTVQRTRGA
jgi:glycerol-3-phosphate acyltransferase PlsY